MALKKISLKSSLFSFLRREPGRLDGRQAQQLESVRAAMLSYLDTPNTNILPTLERRIRNSKDVHALWYLRADLMAVVAGRDGESAARDKMEHLTGMFQGMLPRSLKARRTSLGA